MKVGPTSPNSRPNSPRAGKIGWSTTPSTCSGEMATLRNLPQIERKQMLVDLMGENDVGMPVLYSEHLTGCVFRGIVSTDFTAS